MQAQTLLPFCAMAFVLISWLSISVVFCLALVRAASRRCNLKEQLKAPMACRAESAMMATSPKALQPRQPSPLPAIS